jgi:hypothetical protein
MGASNPYQPPEQEAGVSQADSPLTLASALMFVLKTAAILAVVGAALGLLIGLGVPQYYRMVLGVGDDPDFYPAVAGILLGFMQGGMLGIFAGLVLVGIVGWLRTRAPLPRR